MANRLIGKDFTPPDVLAKVTGRAKYAEDYRAEGMLFCKLLTSPMPHARVRRIDAAAALKMPGVVAILTADEVPKLPEPQDPILTNEPHYVGDPILAVAAVSEEAAAAAIEALHVDLEMLPFTVDPLESLYPGGPNARSTGNAANVQVPLTTVKWTAQDFAGMEEGRLPQGKPTNEWSYGDLAAGFAKAKVVVEDSFVTPGINHHAMEPRSCMAYWQNGRCFVHGSTQSHTLSVPGLAKLIGITPDKLVFIAEFCGGGFGGKSEEYPQMAIPAYLAKKAGRPVMMRITREEESNFVARSGFQGSAKIGFAADGRITALDLYVVQDNGANVGFWDYTDAADTASLLYQPPAMRFRGISVLTNTVARTAQRGPGTNQISMAIEPFLDRAARALKLDRLAIRRINAPDNAAKFGAKQGPITSAYQREALDKGAALFKWADQVKLSSTRQDGKLIGVGVGQGHHTSGYTGFDGLVRILPDGKLYIHTGVGNLGTYTYASTARAAAEVLGYDWNRCVVVWGNSDKHLPWNFGQFSSNTAHTESRTNYFAAMDAKAKLLEIAAHDLGGAPADYDLANERVVAKADPSKSISFADAARRAIVLGGKYSGQEVPKGINPITAASVAGLAGTGLIGVAKDGATLPGAVPALAAGFMKIALDVETGQVDLLDYVCVADCGVVLHPRGLAEQAVGALVQGLGIVRFEHVVYDHALGIPATASLEQGKPPTYLDIPARTTVAAVERPDPSHPLGIKGSAEPIEGCAIAALVCAISDALGGHYFNRVPITRDDIANALAKRAPTRQPLEINVV
ncbi:MAG TPA: xanthine dehydrogenase family protein molybdopterin-binding subunit [Hyphomicrobiales bacterium]|nr:xanthine dehydrogenase family protein molybdopterin-binding subunit [Hyphomicrobiales bacterium]